MTKNQNMNFRPATIGDFSALIAMDALCRSDRSRASQLHRSIVNGYSYVLIDDDRIVAYGTMAPSFFHRLFIEMLYLAVNERRKGYGSRMLVELEALASKHGQVWISTNESNTAIRALLLKYGYVAAGHVDGLDEGDPELIFSKKLNT